MKSVLELWNSRLEEHIKEVRSYLRYMLNDHLLIVMIFLLAGGALWYQSWLKELPEAFPAEMATAAVLAAVLILSSVRTLFKEADLVFLLPLEGKMNPYLRKAKTYSFIQFMLPIILLFLLLGPLYLAVSSAGAWYLATGVLLLLLIWWNMDCDWYISFSQENISIAGDRLVRFALNAAVLYFVLSAMPVYALIIALLMGMLYMYYRRTAKGKGLRWDRLIRAEYRKKQSFYRLANLFTDVPKLRKEAKRRIYLDWILSSIKFGQEHVYLYMLSRAFIRGTDYLGVFIRLTVIAGAVAFFAETNLYGAIAVILAAIFLTGVQLISLVKHFDMLSLPDLYPVRTEVKSKSFYTLLRTILLTQGFLIGAVLMLKLEWIQGAASIGAAVVFVFIFVYGYVRRRVEAMTSRGNQ
ncbi:ABC transporter permease [Metabacillus sp. 84]|uniref:ABC transporter permease n=1 Tax=Metabacillus sp. 84 TaxID=3404705 RepID=UPI003CE77BCF